MLPLVLAHSPIGVSWFTGGGCVVEVDGQVEVSVGGILVGRYQTGDTGARNAVLVGLAADRHMHLGHLARAFGLSEEALRLIRRRHEQEGLPRIVMPRRGGGPSKVDNGLRRRLEQMFAEGLSVTEAHARVSRRRKISRATVGVVRREWGAAKAAAKVTDAAPPVSTATQAQPLELPLAIAPVEEAKEAAPVPALTATVPTEITTPSAQSLPPSEDAATSSAPDAALDVALPSVAAGGEPHAAPFVQHVGGWLILAAMARYGLYRLVSDICAKERLDEGAVRVAVDSFALSLAMRQGCVEGVRRLATPTAPTLLRSERAPSADWVRRTLGRFADVGAERFHLGMAGHYLDAARGLDGPAVFYVDNHLRPYTGQAVLRRGWRMQDKRPRPGTTDYYVHDEDGRPVLRVVSPSHASLTEVIFPVADLLRAGLGDDQRILLGFDRAAAFAETLKDLREESFEFVTYERRPYRMLRPKEFKHEMALDVGGTVEQIQYSEFWVAMRRGRGDVRRIAMRTPEGRQVNILAMSREPAPRLISILRGRWGQENGLKHAVERWSINHLDGRRTEPVAPDTIIPNPARRRLDRALRMACVEEGLARRQLANLDKGNPRHEEAKRDLEEALAMQRDLLEQRQTVPARAPVAETELAGKLVFHPARYKTVLDTIRIACANAEADLAAALAPLLPRAAEAKKTLANLLASPGRVKLRAKEIRVELAPAATGPEQAAFERFFAKVSADRLRLPGDHRTLNFRSQVQ